MAPDLLDQLKAVDVRHAEIGDEDARRLGIEVAERFLSGPRRRDLRAGRLEQLRDQRQRVGVVVNGEDMNRLADRRDGIVREPEGERG